MLPIGLALVVNPLGRKRSRGAKKMRKKNARRLPPRSRSGRFVKRGNAGKARRRRRNPRRKVTTLPRSKQVFRTAKGKFRKHPSLTTKYARAFGRRKTAKVRPVVMVRTLTRGKKKGYHVVHFNEKFASRYRRDKRLYVNPRGKKRRKNPLALSSVKSMFKEALPIAIPAAAGFALPTLIQALLPSDWKQGYKNTVAQVGGVAVAAMLAQKFIKKPKVGTYVLVGGLLGLAATKIVEYAGMLKPGGTAGSRLRGIRYEKESLAGILPERESLGSVGMRSHLGRAHIGSGRSFLHRG